MSEVVLVERRDGVMWLTLNRPAAMNAVSPAMMAALDGAIAQAESDEAVRCGLPGDWPEFRRYFAAVRKAGHYISKGELEPQLAAVAAPVLKSDGGAWAAISLVFDTSRLAIVDLEKMVRLITEAATRIGGRLA